MVGSMKACKLTYMVLGKELRVLLEPQAAGRDCYTGLAWASETSKTHHPLQQGHTSNKCHFLWACGCHSYADYHKGQVRGWRLFRWLSTLQSMYEALDSVPSMYHIKVGEHQDHLQLHDEFGATLSYLRLCLKNTKCWVKTAGVMLLGIVMYTPPLIVQRKRSGR